MPQENFATTTADLLERLIAIKSPVGHERAITEYLATELESLGYVVTRVEAPLAPDHPEYSWAEGAPPGTFGIVARHPSVTGVPAYTLFSHIDTEPDTEWPADPFTMRREERRLLGLGAADAKSGVAAILAAVGAIARLADAGRRFPDVVLAAAKFGGARGMVQALTQARPARRALYCHPAESGDGLLELKVGSRGILTHRWEITGASATPREINTPISVDPREAINPITIAQEVITRLAAALPRGTRQTVSAISAPGPRYGVPARATLEVSTWFTEGDHREIDAIIEREARSFVQHEYGSRARFTCEPIGLRANPATTTDAGFIDEVRTAVARVTGERPEPYAWHTCSDIRLPMLISGVPTIGFGPVAGDFYAPGEWVDADSLAQTAQILFALLTSDEE